eukprot:6752240-Pyramimonas_sp.AAC.2
MWNAGRRTRSIRRHLLVLDRVHDDGARVHELVGLAEVLAVVLADLDEEALGGVHRQPTRPHSHRLIPGSAAAVTGEGHRSA